MKFFVIKKWLSFNHSSPDEIPGQRCGQVRFHNSLEKISLLYIFLPSILFCFGWLKLYISIPVILAQIAGVYFSVKPTDRANQKETYPIFSPIALFAIVSLVFVVVFLSGIGGYIWQHWDYYKHNAFLKDLIEYSWPVGFDNMGPEHKSYMLVTYVGYYLPSAVIGKVLGWNAANHFSFFWGFLGVLLSVYWFLRLINKASFVFALLFLFFGGLDILAVTLLYGWPHSAANHLPLDGWLHRAPFINEAFWIYFSHIFVLYAAPHHVLPGWIIVLMIMYNAMYRRSTKSLLFLWAALPLCSVFMWIGTLPFVFASFYTARFKGVFSFPNLVAAPLLLLISILFISSNNAEYPHGWIWEYYNLLNIWPILLLFYAIEFGLYAVFCPKIIIDHPVLSVREWWWISIGCLLLCPFYRLGTYCDFTSKTCIPSLVVFLVFISATIIHAKTDKDKMCVHVLKLLLVIGACTGLFWITRVIVQGGVDLSPPPPSSVKHVDEIINDNWEVTRQLTGDPEQSFFWQYLAKSRD
jgi:hypothetical protein